MRLFCFYFFAYSLRSHFFCCSFSIHLPFLLPLELLRARRSFILSSFMELVKSSQPPISALLLLFTQGELQLVGHILIWYIRLSQSHVIGKQKHNLFGYFFGSSTSLIIIFFISLSKIWICIWFSRKIMFLNHPVDKHTKLDILTKRNALDWIALFRLQTNFHSLTRWYAHFLCIPFTSSNSSSSINSMT